MASTKSLRWEVFKVVRMLDAGVPASKAYPPEVVLYLTNRKLQALWNIHVRCEYRDRRFVTLYYELEEKMCLSNVASLLSAALKEDIKEDSQGAMPDRIYITAKGTY